jgi:hypothetical protein
METVHRLRVKVTANRRTAEPQNFEYRMMESPGQRKRLRRVLLNLFVKQIEINPSTFDIHYSIFDIRF